MTASLAVPIAAILTGLGTGEREAVETGRWLEELIDDARRGWPVPEFNRAEIVEHIVSLHPTWRVTYLPAPDASQRPASSDVDVDVAETEAAS